jgi:hypothetical protein
MLCVYDTVAVTNLSLNVSIEYSKHLFLLNLYISLDNVFETELKHLLFLTLVLFPGYY